MFVTAIQQAFDYHYAVFEKLWGVIDTLTNAQFTQDVPYSHGSLRNHLVHLAAAEGRWRRGLQASPEARSFKLEPANYPDQASVRLIWDENRTAMQAYLASLDEAALAATPPGFSGPTWQVLLHLVNHGTDHRAQMLRLLDELGAPTFPQDMIFHFWPR